MSTRKELDEFERDTGIKDVVSAGGFSLPGESGGGALLVLNSSDAAKKAFSSLVQDGSDVFAPIVVGGGTVLVLSNLLRDGYTSRSEALDDVRNYLDRAVFTRCAGTRSELASYVGGLADPGPSTGGTTSEPAPPPTYTDAQGNTVPAAP